MVGFGRFGRWASLAPAGCFALYVASATAQTITASDKAAAEALFDQGVRLMKQNNFAEACHKLEESERIEPAVGTLLYLGECYERVGRTASAWAIFREAASLASNSNQIERARVATSRAQELEPKLSRLSVELAPEVSKIAGVVVKRGNQRLEPSLYGVPLPVDPGEYRVEVSAPGYEAWSTPIKVEGGGASASVRVPALLKSRETPASAALATAPAAAGKPGDTTNATQLTLAKPSGRGLSTQQTLGLVAGGIGLIGLGLGSYFGIRAIEENSDAEEHCPETGLCMDQAGLTLTEEAQQDAQLSNIAFLAGGVLAATGAVLYLTGAPTDADRVALVPLLGPSTAAASLRGRF